MKVPRLKEWRERRALTQTELAGAAGVAQENVSRMERGIRGCRPSTARRLAVALDIDVEELVVSSEEAGGGPKAIAPALIKRSLKERGVETARALLMDEETYLEGSRAGNDTLRERLIPAIRLEQRALRGIAADKGTPPEIAEYADVLADELTTRMMRLIADARRRERSKEGRRRIDATAAEMFSSETA